MDNGFDLVTRINASARAARVAPSVAQFENLATHGQYRVPYEIAARHVAAGDRVLDWGCGNGHFTFLLQHLGATVTGFSFEPRPAWFDTHGSAAFVAGSESDPRSLPFAPASFDCVCSVGVLEHVWETGGDEASSLDEIARVLQPGGTFLTFHLPNRLGWVEPVFRVFGALEYFHRRRYDESSIRAMWSQAGLDVVEVGTYNFFPRNQLRRFPTMLRHQQWFARLYTAIDAAFERLLGRFATNYYIVARKPR